MKLRTIVPMTAAVVAAVGIAAGTAHGAPAPTPVDYSATVEGSSVVTTLDGGSFALTSDGKFVAVEDAGGNVVTQFPLEFPFGGKLYPVAQKITEDGSKLSLTPMGLPLHQVATNEENDLANRAFNKLFYSPQSGAGAIIAGTLFGIVGLLLGAVAGCVAGFTIGLAFLGAGSVPGCVIGLVAGAVGGAGALGFSGAFLGVAIAGGLPLYQAWEDLFYTVTGAPWTSKFYDNPNNGLQQNTPIPVGPPA